MSKRTSFLTYLSNLYILVFTWRHGELVGADGAGNRYYREKNAKDRRRERRWVLYAGDAEASKVPPEWHGWLHHQQLEPIKEGSLFQKPWQKPHLPNPTGTIRAYLPPGHPLLGGQRRRATGDYEPWTPG